MIKAIIADEEEAIGQIEPLLADLWPDLVVCGRARSGPEALRLIEKHKPQLAILEVRLPGICGMQVARKITGACQVVFTTSYDHYAVNAFDSGALDYLLKPVSRERLQKAIQRSQRQLASSAEAISSLSHGLTIQEQADSPVTLKHNFRQWICTQSGSRSKFMPVDQACYFQSYHKYTSVVTRESETLITKSIRCLVEELDPSKFWRIHRSTVVNVAQIAGVSRSMTGRGVVRLKDRPENLTVSRPYLHLFKQV
ncbi:MAG: LytTR family DNA-binding domain-containing protein [Desulfatitalea sp.]